MTANIAFESFDLFPVELDTCGDDENVIANNIATTRGKR